MKMELQFITKPQKRKIKKNKKIKKTMVKFRSDHTPLEIQHMSNDELEYLYEHGSETEQDMAENILHARKKWALIDLAMPMDVELASGTGSPYASDVRF